MAKHESVYLRKLLITGFKAIDDIQLEFPEPLMSRDPDVFVMGSKNGIGKTSILEAISLLTLTAANPYVVAEFYDDLCKEEDIGEILIRSGYVDAMIDGEFEVNGKPFSFGIQIDRKRMRYHGNEIIPMVPDLPVSQLFDMLERSFASLMGKNSDPLVISHFMYLNSYRKVREGNLELGMMVGKQRQGSVTENQGGNASMFKLEVLRAMMGRGGLFQDLNSTESEQNLAVLNGLLEEFAKGRIGKFRHMPNGMLELQVEPLQGGDPYPFDGLSSGQKEIISTLFLIWHHTHKQPGIVLIDEPELHLNAEWHRKFVRHLQKMVTANQYIMATHSSEVFASVEQERRIMIRKMRDGHNG